MFMSQIRTSSDQSARPRPALLYDKTRPGALAVELALRLGAELWHAPGQGRAYGTWTNGKRRENALVGSTLFSSWLRREFHTVYGELLKNEPLKDVLGTLEARALAGDEHEVHLRVAEHGERVYLDLADEMGTVAVV